MFLLLLVLLALIVWRGWALYDLLAETRPDLEKGVRLGGVVFGCVLSTVVSLTVAGAIGTGAYLVTGRSDGAANAAIGLMLLLACGWFGFLTYGTLTAPRTPPATGALRTLDPTINRPPLRNEAVELMEAQKLAMREQMERTRRYAIDGGSGAPQPSQTTTTPTESTPAPVPIPVKHEPTAAELEEAKVAQQALAPLRKDIQSKLDGFLTEAGALVTSLGSSPKALKSELESRIATTSSLKGKASDLEAYLRSLDSKADAALKAAGLDFGGQIRQKIAFIQSLDAFTAANACGVYSRLFDAGLEEAQALRDNAGKWRYDASNQVSSTDRGLQMRLRHLREAVLQHLRSIPDAESALKRLKQSALLPP